MPRYFTLKQAQQLLPDVEPALREAIALKSQYQAAEAECQDFQHRISMQGGTLVDPTKFLEKKQRRDSSAQQLKRALDTVNELGCLVKDLDIGLIDFPTLFRGQEVYLCWKLGEKDIQFWHGVDEGFRGRKPIDQEFLDHHQGDLAN